ncbi:MAG: glycosyltransferase [Bacteroidia bacterium]
MKILCVIDSLGSGGAQRQLVGLAIGFKERGHEVSFLTYHPINFYKELLDEVNIPVTTILEYNYLKRLFKMRHFIRSGKYESVLSFLEAANLICEISGFPFRKWKLVVGERSANPDILNSFKLKFYRWFHIFADYIVANSNENILLIKRINFILTNRKCKVIYNLVDENIWSSSSDYTPFKNDKLNILVAASHQYLKNCKGLIEALNKLSEFEKSKIKIDWYGDESPDNSYSEALLLVEKYSLRNIISFHKASKKIDQFMKQADLVALFSFYEGLPNVLCEAMVLGKPIISSSVSDIPILLNDNLECVFDPRNNDEITKVLSFVLTLSNNELSKLGNHNKNIGLLLFEKNKIVSKYLELLMN